MTIGEKPGKKGPAARLIRSAFLSLPTYPLVKFVLVTVLVEVFIQSERGVLIGPVGRSLGRVQRRGLMGFADSLETVADRCGFFNEGNDSHCGAAAGTGQWKVLVEARDKQGP